MKDAQKPDHKNLNTLLLWLKEGHFVIFRIFSESLSGNHGISTN